MKTILAISFLAIAFLTVSAGKATASDLILRCLMEDGEILTARLDSPTHILAARLVFRESGAKSFQTVGSFNNLNAVAAPKAVTKNVFFFVVDNFGTNFYLYVPKAFGANGGFKATVVSNVDGVPSSKSYANCLTK